MSVPPEIVELVERFDRNKAAYTGGRYNETQLRREFLDPFFAALGWDVDNKQGWAEAYKDVIHEDAIRIGGSMKAPDYSFRIGGARKFFLEAKKPSVSVREDAEAAYQLRRYAWSAKLPLSILSDFEDLAVYDCRVKPAPGDKASAARVMLFAHGEYPARWDEIAAVFARDAVLRGSFDKYAETSAGKRGTAEVDDAFLQQIEGWREALAHNLALRNPGLSTRELNFAVQRTIDRLIFLRICEDRAIEEPNRLQGLLNGGRIYERLIELYREADARFNSGLFHFDASEKLAEAADSLTPGLLVDDKPLKEIIGGLYYPESPYVFSVFPADILGQVYEQFLGKVIRLTAGHQAKVEDKPEVKKAGGVFYTPTYIVDYIVRGTLGKLLEGKTPRQVAGAAPGALDGRPLRLADPACGSGSFLIGAYQYLLDWHRDWYVEHLAPLLGAGKAGISPEAMALLPERPARRGRRAARDDGAALPIFQGPGGDWRLTTAERKRILLAHIFGVDVDAQAVEVTKMSLLLKVLEGESAGTLSAQLSLFRERALPDLGENVKCGNSLVGPDFYDDEQMSLLPADEQYRVNAFDWRAGFPQVFGGPEPGFDVVIGNPPYGAFLGEAEKDYVRARFKSYKYRYDSYIYFIEKAFSLTNGKGYISYITPELWLKLENGAPLRRLIAQNAGFQILKICGENVFRRAVVNTVVFVLRKGASFDAMHVEMNGESWELPTRTWTSSQTYAIDYRMRPSTYSLVARMRATNVRPLSDFGETIQGITPYDKYRGQDPMLIKRRGYHYAHKHDDTCGKWLAGEDVSRYELGWSGEWLSYGPWLGAPRDPSFFEGPRLLFREVPGRNKRIQCTIAEGPAYHGHSITPFKPNLDNVIGIRYLLGLANSKLLSWYGGLMLPNFGKEVFPKLNPQDIKALPIRTIDFSDPADKARHERMVALVERMLALHKQAAGARTDQEKTVAQRQIEVTDRQIDRLVYELYGLSEEEVAIVEGRE